MQLLIILGLLSLAVISNAQFPSGEASESAGNVGQLGNLLAGNSGSGGQMGSLLDSGSGAMNLGNLLSGSNGPMGGGMFRTGNTGQMGNMGNLMRLMAARRFMGPNNNNNMGFGLGWGDSGSSGIGNLMTYSLLSRGEYSLLLFSYVCHSTAGYLTV